MATHSSTLAWRIPWTEEPGGLHSPRGREESDTTERPSTVQHRMCMQTGEGRETKATSGLTPVFKSQAEEEEAAKKAGEGASGGRWEARST